MSSKIRRYTSDDIDVTYDAKRCIHAAACVRGLPAVFNTKKRPWVQPDNAAANVIAEIVQRCPSGALHYERKDGGTDESIPRQNTITIEENGPLYVSGNVRIQTENGELVYEDTRLALCRCGASNNRCYIELASVEVGLDLHQCRGGQCGTGTDSVRAIPQASFWSKQHSKTLPQRPQDIHQHYW